ncbi:hypothetical protein GLAREA_12635 [Glarea lozoyensis ATCC 20868]|uniref:Extracellular mutant protein 11 C-terminal domain-containing protein n=1 Tax=Glarea lozoyensis (strain ATCC 20868 / MF5171) TaxID=1116229 RepID=S3CYI7_GLAL2|nr:uncharacterized protein GLAREA_12635 [Glarea lozoyensis ATCC 20868]EPE31332.1 hypothetical protein GLAREA_12635 [Glarea lozoyensis ATCC 20868]
MSTSGLSRFTGPKSNDDRARIAAGAKISLKDKKAKSSSTSKKHHHEKNTTNHPVDGHEAYEAYPQHELETTSAQDVFGDSTIASNFDETISSEQLDAPQFHDQYGYQQRNSGQQEPEDSDDEDDTAHQDMNYDLHGRTSAPPLGTQESQDFYNSEQPVPTSRQNRFQELRQHRAVSPAVPPPKVSRKRERTSERHYNHLPIEPQYQQPYPPQEHGAQLVHLPQRPIPWDGHNSQEFLGHHSAGGKGHGFDQSSRTGSPVHQALVQNCEEGIESSPEPEEAVPDYTDEELKKKLFVDLKNEDWGAGMPKYQIPKFFPDDLRGPSISVEQKVDGFRDEEITDEKHMMRSDREQESFFEHLSDEDWKAAGEYIRKKTEEAMNNMQETRKKKREITAKYEKIYEEREKLIQHKAALIQAQLAQVQNQGSSMFQKMLAPSPRTGVSSPRSNSRA